MRIVLAVAAALALTACGSTGLSSQVEELQRRDFTNITTDYDSKHSKEYTVTAGTCRVKMKWTTEDNWSRLEGLNTEVTLTSLLAHKDYAHCAPTTSISSSTPATSPS